MATPLTVDVVTLERAVYSGEASQVVFTAERGELGVLPGHLSLMTRVYPGELRVHKDGGNERFFIGGGFAEVLGNRVTLLVSAAEGMDEIDIERARRALEDASTRLEGGPGVDEGEIREQTERRARALARIRVAERATGARD